MAPKRGRKNAKPGKRAPGRQPTPTPKRPESAPGVFIPQGYDAGARKGVFVPMQSARAVVSPEPQAPSQARSAPGARSPGVFVPTLATWRPVVDFLAEAASVLDFRLAVDTDRAPKCPGNERQWACVHGCGSWAFSEANLKGFHFKGCVSHF